MSRLRYKQFEMENDDADLETSSDHSESDDEYDPLQAIMIYRNMYTRSQGLSVTEKGKGGMWALALKSLGAALRLLAPAALLTIFCGQDSLFVRLLHHCDKAVREVLFPTPDKTDGVLQWLQASLPGDKRTKSLDAVWADGSVLCDLVESVVPGSCQGHAGEERVDLTHGQRLAEQYLGVTPIFSERELSQKVLSTYQECRLTHYLDCVKDALSRISPPVSRTGTPLLNVQAYTLDYVVRGMGLVTASRNRKSTFYIYPTAQQGLEPGDISIQIKGPGNCYGSAVIPVIYGRAHIIRNVFLNLGQHPSYMHIPLPMVQGSSYLRTYDKTSVEKNYFVPKIKNDIEVSIVVRHDRVKVNYVPLVAGYHELSMISKGCHIIGSPFSINVDLGTNQRQTSVDYLDEDVIIDEQNKPDRRVVFRIVDFVTEKMLLTEDGNLEKISDSEAEKLLHTAESLNDMTLRYLPYPKRTLPGPDLIEYNNNQHEEWPQQEDKHKTKKKFITMAKQVVIMLRVCKEFRNLKFVIEKSSFKKNVTDNNTNLRNLTRTPDVVNSTINDNPLNSFLPSENSSFEDTKLGVNELRHQFKKKVSSFNLTIDDDKDAEIADSINSESVPDKIVNSGNDFDTENDSDEQLYIEKRTIHPRMASIEIVISSIDDDDADLLDNLIPSAILPILEELPERPKTPVFKILAEKNMEDSDTVYNEFEHYELEDKMFDSLDEYVDNYCPQTDIALNRNFIETDHNVQERSVSPSINFHIGAPVTPTRMMNAPSLDLDMDSIILATNLEEALNKYDMKLQKNINNNEHENSDGRNSSMCNTPNPQTPFEQMTDSQILRMYEEKVPSLSEQTSEVTEVNSGHEIDRDNISLGNLREQTLDMNENQRLKNIRVPVVQNLESFENEHLLLNDGGRHHSIETWDSAYISIDEINSSPDTNSNSPRSESSSRGKLFAIVENESESLVYKKSCDKSLTEEDFKKMGPAEKEIWKTIKQETKNEIYFNKNEALSLKPFAKVIQTKSAIETIEENDTVLLEIDEKVGADKNNPFFYKSGELKKCNDSTSLHNRNNDDARFEKISLNSSCDKLFLKKETWKHHKQKDKKENLPGSVKKVKATRDGSASDFIADVKRSTKSDSKCSQCEVTGFEISSVHETAESKDESHNIKCENSRPNEPLINPFRGKSTDTLSQQFENDISPMRKKSCLKGLSKMVSEKKEYWDEIIKTLESSDDKRHRSPRIRSTLRRNDSLSKKRGKSIAKIPCFTEKWKQSFDCTEKEALKVLPYPSPNSLVARWKNYWNDMVERANSPETDIRQNQKQFFNSSLGKIEILSLKDSPKKDLGKTEYKFKSIDDININKSRPLLNVSNEPCGNTFLEKENKPSSPFLIYSEKKNIDSDCNIKRYNPRPINLNRLSERIGKFLDSLPSSSPVVETEESRFSTPELPFGGLVSHKISCFSQGALTQEINKDLLKIEKNEDRLTVTWDGYSTDKRMKSFQVIGNAPTPDLRVTVVDFVTKNGFDSEKSLSGNVQLVVDEESEYTTPEPNEKISDNDEFKDFPTISEIKAKIENNEKNAKDFKKQLFFKKSHTIDIPKLHSFEKLKRYFSVESLEKNIDNKNSSQLFQRNNVLTKGQSLKNVNFDGSEKHSTFINEKTVSIESIPSISERKARIEKHLQSVQKRLNQNQSDAARDESEKHNLVNDIIMLTDRPSIISLENVNDSAEEKIASYSVEKYVYEKEKENVKKKKPVGAIVAAFENWVAQPQLQNANPTEISVKRKRLLESETKNGTLKNKNNTKQNDSVQFANTDAENKEGTVRKENTSTISEAKHKEIVQEKMENLKASGDKIFLDTLSVESEMDSLNEINHQLKNQDQQNENRNSIEKNENQIDLVKCKERFRKAKLFFQTLDDVNSDSIDSNNAAMNECEKILHGVIDTRKKDVKNLINDKCRTHTKNQMKTASQSINENDRRNKKIFNERSTRRDLRKYPIKSFSAPTSDAESDHQSFEGTRRGSCKLKKISEKFFVEDLFQDIAGESNKTSVGIFKGIPHKNAVLAAFRSMENVSQTTSYEYTVSQMEDFAKKNSIINAQTYHSEYPHLPTTQPGKYRARRDYVATGLILRKDLLKIDKPRRNSAPDACEMKLSFVAHV